MRLKELLLGGDGGLTNGELRRMTRRNRLSDYLPYMAYDPEKSAYINTDQTIGFIWECVPLVYAGKETFEMLGGIFTLGLPAGSVVQFMLYADPHILPYTRRFKELKTRESGLMDTVTDRTVEFYNTGSRQGFDRLQGVPARNFRLFVSVKLQTPIDEIKGV